MRATTHPFVFTGCVELREALDVHALDERELLDRLREAPADSIFFHTHGYFLRHRPFTTAWGNDFARWAAVELRDPVLGERLAVVDPFAFPALDGLREELVTIVDRHVRDLGAVVRLPWGRGFHFQQSHVVEVPLGVQATTLREFRDALSTVDASAIYLHMVDARARRGRGAGDFAEWLRAALGRPALAEQVGRIDAYLTTLERVRGRLLDLVDAVLEEDGE
ncbi:MAG: hypothetical protein A3H48_05850 [Candidatus Rokubacteria bacterium RIFCSPLOWO2_02_FULL_71_18]|nr:MAG: hypothetical protein A3H48_05850 [Candidatus Rokubacteria bacterium RIFCSPLOWO2_02_FULL_71_18]